MELDPDLGALLGPERRRTAERELHVVVERFNVGLWEIDTPPADAVGWLIVDGVLAREVLLEDHVCTELLGTGDLLRVRHIEPDERLLQHELRWHVLADLQIAFLDRRIAVLMRHFPELHTVLLDRIDQRAERMAVDRAIMQLKRVDRRLLCFFWHLAERWGHVTSEGVAIPLYLSHRMLGELIGAQRPTVSTALAALSRDGLLQRRKDGSWLLTGQPVGNATSAARRFVPVRRRLILNSDPD